MCKCVKLHLSVNTNILDILSQQLFFMGFRIQFCFQILTLEIGKYCFKQNMKIEFLGEKCHEYLSSIVFLTAILKML